MLVGDVSLKVTPAILYKKAESLRTHLKQIEEGFSEINMCFERMEDYWIGKAGGEHRKLYEKQKGDVEEVLNRLKKHTEHLQEIAGIYDSTLPQIRDHIIAPLPDNIIS